MTTVSETLKFLIEQGNRNITVTTSSFKHVFLKVWDADKIRIYSISKKAEENFNKCPKCNTWKMVTVLIYPSHSQFTTVLEGSLVVVPKNLLLPWKASVKSGKFTGWLCKCNLTQTLKRPEGSENREEICGTELPYFIFTNFIGLQTKKKIRKAKIFILAYSIFYCIRSATLRLMTISNSEVNLLTAKSSKRKNLWSKTDSPPHCFFWNAIFPVCNSLKK